jgi:ceroid-lipofuscinosis MFS transporter 7
MGQRLSTASNRKYINIIIYICIFLRFFILIVKISLIQAIDPHKSTTHAPSNGTMPRSTTEDPPTGCPLDFKWCYDTPIVQLYQYLIGFALLVIGYSIANVMSFAIYSKLLGPKPQGTMMGLLTSCGSLARTVGPIAVSYLYDYYGPRYTFISLAVLNLAVIITIISSYKRYKPYRFAS